MNHNLPVVSKEPFEDEQSLSWSRWIRGLRIRIALSPNKQKEDEMH